MKWREVLPAVRHAMNGQRVTVYMGETTERAEARHAEAGLRRLMAYPEVVRVALARELLAGTGRVVARDLGTIEDSEHGQGWNACRAAMLGDE